MTVSSLCNDMLILAVFMLAGFFIREIFKPVQKLFLPSSLIGGLLLLLLGHQAMGIIAVPESFHELPGVLIDIVMASLVFGVNFNREKISSYLDYSCVTMTSYGMQMCLGVGLGWILSKDFPRDGASWAFSHSMAATEQPLPRRLLFRSWAWTATWQWEWCCLPLALYLPWLWEWPWSITGSEKDGVHM